MKSLSLISQTINTSYLPKTNPSLVEETVDLTPCIKYQEKIVAATTKALVQIDLLLKDSTLTDLERPIIESAKEFLKKLQSLEITLRQNDDKVVIAMTTEGMEYPSDFDEEGALRFLSLFLDLNAIDYAIILGDSHEKAALSAQLYLWEVLKTDLNRFVVLQMEKGDTPEGKIYNKLALSHIVEVKEISKIIMTAGPQGIPQLLQFNSDAQLITMGGQTDTNGNYSPFDISLLPFGNHNHRCILRHDAVPASLPISLHKKIGAGRPDLLEKAQATAEVNIRGYLSTASAPAALKNLWLTAGVLDYFEGEQKSIDEDLLFLTKSNSYFKGYGPNSKPMIGALLEFAKTHTLKSSAPMTLGSVNEQSIDDEFRMLFDSYLNCEAELNLLNELLETLPITKKIAVLSIQKKAIENTYRSFFNIEMPVTGLLSLEEINLSLQKYKSQLLLPPYDQMTFLEAFVNSEYSMLRTHLNEQSPLYNAQEAKGRIFAMDLLAKVQEKSKHDFKY